MLESDQVRSFIEANFKDEDARWHALAEWFYESVKTSKRFQWIGMGSVEDELDRSRLVIYLSERTDENDGQDQRLISISPAFTALSLELRPKIFLDLYFMKEPYDNSPLAERAMKSMQNRYGKQNHNPKAQLLWEEYLFH